MVLNRVNEILSIAFDERITVIVTRYCRRRCVYTGQEDIPGYEIYVRTIWTYCRTDLSFIRNTIELITLILAISLEKKKKLKFISRSDLVVVSYAAPCTCLRVCHVCLFFTKSS